jgi:hypothetical protein
MISLLLGAIVIELLGITLAARLGLSQSVSVGVGVALGLLLVFPIMRFRYHGKLTFTVWASAVTGMVIAGLLIQRIVS